MKEELLLNTPSAKEWQSIGIRHHHGINLPLFSLHSKNSCGIGEFTDIIPFIGWCKELGLDVIQQLPLNDTGRDSGPYSAISAFALNPIHLGLTALPNVDQYEDLQPIIKSLRDLNRTPRVDYLHVREGKKKFLRAYYNYEGSRILSSTDYQQFVEDNDWLDVFALFKTLKILHNWKSWIDWEEDLKYIDQDRFDELCVKHQDQLDYHKSIQYLCFRQMQSVKEIANDAGIYLKGDIPILLNRDSADVWYHHSLFKLEFEAGAPPDMYSSEGQNWGFPTYNWPEHDLTDYAWWRKRLKVASTLYDIYRIDHVVGFFRIWMIPSSHKAWEGHYFPANLSDALEQGERIMRVMLDTPMLPIGEDLGAVPHEVRECLTRLGIPGTKVMRWERFWDAPGQPYIMSTTYSPLSMTTVSTHDSETVEMWWKSHPNDARAYCREKDWEYARDIRYSQLKEILTECHQSSSLFHINLLQEYLPLVPELRGHDHEAERVNIPGLVSDNNWSFRFYPTVEDLVSHKTLKDVIREVTT